MENWSLKKYVVLAAVIIFSILLLPMSFSVFENLEAEKIMVIQSPISGDLEVYVDPGLKWQGFGKITKYPRRHQYSFIAANAKDDTGSKRLRFNDGGHANLSGAVSWEMPLSKESIIKIHKTFGSAEAIEQQAVAKMIDASVYLAGPLMSSTESSGERRSELVQYINDQAEHGVYVTVVKEKDTIDPVTGAKKQVAITEIVRDEKGSPRRQQGSMLNEFHIKLLPLSITELKYDAVVEDQIKQRQVATTQVQIAQANAKKAEQDVITTEKQGQAKAATAKWEQETIKAKEVTLAEQKLAVATLAAKEAEQYKKEQILRGEGEGSYKRLVMEADGALELKLGALIVINKNYAEAMAKAQPGAWTPSVVMGNGGAGAPNTGAQALMDLFAIKVAKDVGVDLRVTGAEKTKGK